MSNSFERTINKLSDIAVRKENEAQVEVDKVTKLIQTKYPELRAEYSASDGGIIFIDDSNMNELYNCEMIYAYYGER